MMNQQDRLKLVLIIQAQRMKMRLKKRQILTFLMT